MPFFVPKPAGLFKYYLCAVFPPVPLPPCPLFSWLLSVESPRTGVYWLRAKRGTRAGGLSASSKARKAESPPDGGTNKARKAEDTPAGGRTERKEPNNGQGGKWQKGEKWHKGNQESTKNEIFAI